MGIWSMHYGSMGVCIMEVWEYVLWKYGSMYYGSMGVCIMGIWSMYYGNMEYALWEYGVCIMGIWSMYYGNMGMWGYALSEYVDMEYVLWEYGHL